MTYGSQTIQQQGRLIEVGSQEGIVKGEHGQGEGWKMAKKPCKHDGDRRRNKWGQCPTCLESKKPKKEDKPLFTCRHCGKGFKGNPREKNHYCGHHYHNEFRVMKWLPCSTCMAKAGIGSQTAGKLLGMDSATIRRNWKRRGINSKRPKSGSIIHEGRMIVTKARQEDQAKWRQYEKDWMDEIRSHSRFPDWSYEWQKEQSRKIGVAKYQAMSHNERRERNKRIMAKRCPIKFRKTLRDWKRKERVKNPAYRIIESFRSRLWKVANGKEARTMDLVGCSLAEFRVHIERHFKHGMTWENYGTHWHVDHTIPVSSFDHNDPKQVKQCWHWTNLRPMTATRNISKGSRITNPQMELLLCAH